MEYSVTRVIDGITAMLGRVEPVSEGITPGRMQIFYSTRPKTILKQKFIFIT
jgi:hypothetical protein